MIHSSQAAAPPAGIWSALSLVQIRWGWKRAAFALAVVALLGWALLALGSVRDILRTSSAIWMHPDLLLLFVAAYSAAFALRALAWRLLLDRGPGVLRLFGFLQVALLANHLFPAKAGEAVRAGLLARTGMPLGEAAGSTIVARLLDLGMLCLLALACAPLAGAGSGTVVAALAVPVAVLASAGALLRVVAAGRLEWLWQRLPAGVAAVARQTATALAEVRPGSLLGAAAATLPSWLLEAAALWSVASAAGAAVSLPLAVAATAFTIAFQGVQFTPGGIGVYEASMTGVLALSGMGTGAALALAVATHALKFVYSYGFGLVCALVEAAIDVRSSRTAGR